MNNQRIPKLFALSGFGACLLVMALAVFGLFGLTAGSASASSAPSAKVVYGGGTVTATVTDTPAPTSASTPSPAPTHTPRPIKLRPWVQFDHARPGGEAHFRKLLFNHLPAPGTANLSGGSVRGWDVTVSPSVANILPGYANIVTVTVGVPVTPMHRIDVERVRAVLSDTQPYTTTAYMVTITRRVPLTDLPEGHWADDAVQYLMDAGVITGYSDGSFRPNDLVNRAQFAKMLVTAMGWTLQTPANPTFSDVPTDYWAYSSIETAAAHGVLGGYSDGAFRPGSPVTRAQLAKMVFTALGWRLDTPNYTNFSDVRQGDWSYNFVQAASSAEVMGGYADRSFRPNAPATRAQVAKILALCMFSDPNN